MITFRWEFDCLSPCEKCNSKEKTIYVPECITIIYNGKGTYLSVPEVVASKFLCQECWTLIYEAQYDPDEI